MTRRQMSGKGVGEGWRGSRVAVMMSVIYSEAVEKEQEEGGVLSM
jgi:hypothetical protein